jgi:hypothetical protein
MEGSRNVNNGEIGRPEFPLGANIDGREISCFVLIDSGTDAPCYPKRTIS